MNAQRNRWPLIIGCIGAGSHLCLLFWFIHFALTTHDSEWPIGWVIFLVGDFPISLIYFLLPGDALYRLLHPFIATSSLAGSRMGDVYNFILPVAYFGVVGTLWWFWLCLTISKQIRRLTQK